MRKITVTMRIRRWLSRHSSRRFFFAALRLAVTGIVAVALFIGVVHLPLVSVRSVEISALSDVSPALRRDVLAYVSGILDPYHHRVIPGSVRHFFGRKGIEEDIRERFLGVGSVEIDWKFFNVWSVTLNRREVFGTSCDASRCLLLDSGGLVFGETGVPQGRFLTISGDVIVGDSVFIHPSGTGDDDFRKIPRILEFLENLGLTVEQVELRWGSRDVRVRLSTGTGVWVDVTEPLSGITRALHVVFSVTFPDDESRSDISSIVLCDPQRVFWSREDEWEKGCNVLVDEDEFSVIDEEGNTMKNSDV